MSFSFSLSTFVRQNPKSIDGSLEKLTCTSQGITHVDVHPAALSTLTSQASKEVKSLAQDYLRLSSMCRHVSREETSAESIALSDCSSSAPPSRHSVSRGCEQRGGTSEGEGSYLNIALALSLHTVLLSRNKLTSLVGIVQFKNVVRLSLLGNQIRRVEDCEPLGLLPHLAFLSLEFNPVCAVPHYRAHLLRITSWPKELSLRNCRLRKLDAMTVRPSDITRSVSCLQREMSLLPELTQRQRLASFIGHVEQTMRLHQEMRRRGVLVHETSAEVTLPLVLERCSGAALEVADFAAAAHMTRMLVMEQHREAATERGSRIRKTTAPETSTGTKGHPQAPERERRQASLDVMVTRKPNESTAHDVSPFSAPDCLDVSVETRTSEDGRAVISVLDEVSEICLEDLSWAKLSLSNAEQSQHDAVCEEWSNDRFRATLSFLDIRICTHLLRTARMLGQTLTSADVDAYCRSWMRILSRHSGATADTGNVTGRRTLRTFVASVGEPMRPTPQRQSPRSRRADAATPPPAGRASSSPAGKCSTPSRNASRVASAGPPPDSLSQVSSISSAGDAKRSAEAPRRDSLAQHALEGTLARPAEATADGDEEQGDGTTSSRHEPSDLSEISPRCEAPVAMEARPDRTQLLDRAFPRKPAPPFSPSVSSHTAAPGTKTEDEREKELQGSLSLLQESEKTHHDLCVATFLAKLELQRKASVLQRLCDVFQRRRLEQWCARYRADKLLLYADDLSSLRVLRLVDSVSYIPRKGIFFRHWRERAIAASVFRQIRCRGILHLWQRRTREEQVTGIVHESQCQHLKRAALQRWKTSASQRVARRCAGAKAKVKAAAAEPPIRQEAASPEPRRPRDIHAVPFEVSSLKQALSGGRHSAAVTTPTTSTSPGGLSPIGNEADLPTPSASQGPFQECRLSPPPPFPAVYAAPCARRTGSLCSGAVVMSVASQAPSPGPRATPSADRSAIARERVGKSPSCGLVHSPALRRTSHPGAACASVAPAAPLETAASPFSEDDVAALVAKASALESSRAMLVERVVSLQLECEQNRLLRVKAEAEAADAKEKLKACEATLSRSETQKERLTKDVKHLRQCVMMLREERREWLEHALSRGKAPEAPPPFHLSP